MNQTPLPENTYRALALKLRGRFEFAERILGLNEAPVSYVVETVCLQGRKIVETIAFMGLVGTEHSLGRVGLPRDIYKHTNAAHILKRLKKMEPLGLPSPSERIWPTDPRFELMAAGIDPKPTFVFSGVPEWRLTHDQIISHYNTFSKGLHELNPYAQPKEEQFYEDLLPVVHDAIGSLKNFMWSYQAQIKGRGFLVILSDKAGRFVFVKMAS